MSVDSPEPTNEPRVFGEQQGSTMRRGSAALAWLVIALLVAVVIFLPRLQSPAEVEAYSDDLAIVMAELQGRVSIGIVELLGGRERERMYDEARVHLEGGSVEQRFRFIVLSAELMSVEEARQQLAKLTDLLEIRSVEVGNDSEATLSESQQEVLRLLHVLYDHDGDVPHVAGLATDEKQFLESELGWFGRLALVPPDIADRAAREAVLEPARRVASRLFGTMALLGLGGLLGGVVLIIFLALLLAGRVRGRIGPANEHHAIYAETFAVWLLLFLALQIAAAGIGGMLPDLQGIIALAAFFGSLLALAWPVVRGIPWRQVRQDVGLNLGEKPLLEPFVGIVGYFAGLPVLAAGIAVTLFLVLVQGILAGGNGEALDATSTPAHPIVLDLAEAGTMARVQLLLLAAVAAPIVEEIMFRGVLYRHLRDATVGGSGKAGSIVLSATISGFIFAIIHPQGWVAVPALMSLAYVFAALREWRGTVIPAIVVHAVSNGIVVTLLLTIFGA